MHPKFWLKFDQKYMPPKKIPNLVKNSRTAYLAKFLDLKGGLFLTSWYWRSSKFEVILMTLRWKFREVFDREESANLEGCRWFRIQNLEINVRPATQSCIHSKSDQIHSLLIANSNRSAYFKVKLSRLKTLEFWDFCCFSWFPCLPIKLAPPIENHLIFHLKVIRITSNFEDR